MDLPKFLLADNTDFPDAIFVIHTEYPLMVIDLVTDEVEFLEDVDADNETELTSEVHEIIEQASSFYDREISRYEDE